LRKNNWKKGWRRSEKTFGNLKNQTSLLDKEIICGFGNIFLNQFF
jgi:hypothetical protein